MACPFGDNSFCTYLSEELREQLCRHCHIKRYAKGQWLLRRYWAEELALCVSGLMINGVVNQQGKLITNGMMSKSYFISYGRSIFKMPDDYLDETVLCVTQCDVAVFDHEFIDLLLDSNLEFVKSVFQQAICACVHGTLPMMRTVGNSDAYTAVRYVYKFIQHFRLPMLTHDQVAMICNRSRPTVTKITHELLKKEPELFAGYETAIRENCR